jgi:hypothetical protein
MMSGTCQKSHLSKECGKDTQAASARVTITARLASKVEAVNP